MSAEQLVQLRGKLDQRVPVRVAFLDNSTKLFLITPDTTAHQLVEEVLQRLGMTTPGLMGYFALYESSNGVSLERMLLNDEKAEELVQEWADERLDAARLVFVVRLLMDSVLGIDTRAEIAGRLGVEVDALTHQEFTANTRVKDDLLLNLNYIQAVFNVVTSQFYIDDTTALPLAGLQFVQRFGPYSPTKHAVGFLGSRVVEFIPQHLFDTRDREKWEAAIFEHAAKVQPGPSAADGALTGDEAKRQYLCSIMGLPHGVGMCKFFIARNETQLPSLSTDVYLGIGVAGIIILNDRHDFYEEYPLFRIMRWGYRLNLMFYFEVEGDASETVVLEFTMEDGEDASELLTAYAMAIVAEHSNDGAAAAAASNEAKESEEEPKQASDDARAAAETNAAEEETKKATDKGTKAADEAAKEASDEAMAPEEPTVAAAAAGDVDEKPEQDANADAEAVPQQPGDSKKIAETRAAELAREAQTAQEEAADKELDEKMARQLAALAGKTGCDVEAVRQYNFALGIFDRHCPMDSDEMGLGELKPLCHELGYFLHDAELQEALKELDEDGNGMVSFDEFLNWWTHNDKFEFLTLDEQALAMREKAAKFFDRFDTDGNGSIDLEEFKEMHAHLSDIGMTRRDIDTCLKELDENGDGEIDFNEFVMWVQNHTIRRGLLNYQSTGDDESAVTNRPVQPGSLAPKTAENGDNVADSAPVEAAADAESGEDARDKKDEGSDTADASKESGGETSNSDDRKEDGTAAEEATAAADAGADGETKADGEAGADAEADAAKPDEPDAAKPDEPDAAKPDEPNGDDADVAKPDGTEAEAEGDATKPDSDEAEAAKERESSS